MNREITFAHPELFFLLLLIPALAAWFFLRKRWNQADLQISTNQPFQNVRTAWKIYLNYGLYIIRLIAIALVIIAMARPQTSLSRQDITVEGIDLIIALDISGSMLAMDFKPDRLEASKDVAM